MPGLYVSSLLHTIISFLKLPECRPLKIISQTRNKFFFFSVVLERATQGPSPPVLPEALWGGVSWCGEGSAQVLSGGEGWGLL